MYACLDVDVVVGGFEKRHFNFVPGVARTSAIGLRPCKLSNDVGRRPLRPGEEFPATTARAIVLLSYRVPVWQLKLVIAADGDELPSAGQHPPTPSSYQWSSR